MPLIIVLPYYSLYRIDVNTVLVMQYFSTRHTITRFDVRKASSI